MPTQPTGTQVRLNTLTTCFAITVETLDILANSLQATFMVAIANTTRSLLKNIEVSHLYLSIIVASISPKELRLSGKTGEPVLS
jgi:hypothetical protein